MTATLIFALFCGVFAAMAVERMLRRQGCWLDWVLVGLCAANAVFS